MASGAGGWHGASTSTLVASGVACTSALGSTLVIAAEIVKSRDSSRSVAFLSVAALLNSVAYIWSFVGISGRGAQCQAQAVLFLFSEDACAMWSLMIAVRHHSCCRAAFSRIAL